MIADASGTGVISARKVSRAYAEGASQREILARLELEVAAGEFIAIGGPSGSGKSTLLNLLAGLDVPDAGAIHVAGGEISAMTPARRTRHRRANIGMVFQFFNLVPTLTVEENLQLPLQLNGIPLDGHRIARMLEEFGIGARRNDYPDTLSGGEQQRVAVLRAAIHSPPVILADEPTGNLDRERGGAVIELLGSLARQGTAVVMVTHSRQAAAMAPRRLQLEDGGLVPWRW